MTDTLADFDPSTFTAEGASPRHLPDRLGAGGHRDQ